MRPTVVLAIAAASVLLAAAPLSASVEAVDAYYRPDTAFPQFSQFWGDSSEQEWELGAAEPDGTMKANLGGSVHAFLQNKGGGSVEITDVSVEGVSMKRAIAPSEQRKFKKYVRAYSLYFSDIPKEDRDRLMAAGEPVWWRVEPETPGPGEFAQIVIRLRRAPKLESIKLTVAAGGDTLALTVPVREQRPQFVGIYFSPELDRAYLYVRSAHKGASITKVLVDGREVTSASTIGRDPSMEILPIAAPLGRGAEKGVAAGTVHCFQAVFDDGSKAAAAIRAFAPEFGYGIWGGKPGREDQLQIGREFIQDLGRHSINIQMETIGSDAVRAFMNTTEGRQMLRSLGIRRVTGEPEKTDFPFAYYLADEPDTGDFRVKGVPANSKVGCLARGLVERADELRKISPETPNMLNVNMTFKPDNWYIYGQVPDILAADPYYQTHLARAYWQMPGRVPLYSRATFVHAVASVCASACAPKPLHIILNCAQVVKKDRRFRFGTPQEKRIEVYYALAAGAKSLSYWWYTPMPPGYVPKPTPTEPDPSVANGCGASDPEAKALWQEIGLLGAETRTAGQILTIACPAPLPIKAAPKLWVRSLLAGTDAAVILCVNDDYASDRLGTVINPVQNAEIAVTLPAWLSAGEVFEISASGVTEPKWDLSGANLNLHLGTVDVTRMIVISSKPGLRGRIQSIYESGFAANVAALTAAKDR